MARFRIQTTAIGQSGTSLRVLPGATVSITDPDGALVTLYTAASGSDTADNPYTTGAAGAVDLYVDYVPQDDESLYYVDLLFERGSQTVDERVYFPLLFSDDRQRDYANRAAFLAADIPSAQDSSACWSAVLGSANVFRVEFVRDDAGTIGPTADGGMWAPLGAATPFHFASTVGDGVVDDFAAVQAALNAGPKVHFPRPSVRYRITDTPVVNDDNVEITGDVSEIRQVTASQHNLRINGDYVKVSGLHLWGSGVESSQTSDSGIYLVGTVGSTVENCLFENHAGAGVLMNAAIGCNVRHNRFINSTADGTSETNSFCDIACLRGSQHNIISYNYCDSGQNTGILVQSVVEGDHTDDNEVLFNTILGANAYGICAYRNADTLPLEDQSVLRTKIIGNTIIGVTGSVLNSITETYTFGAGIYTQGAEDSKIHDNHVEDTHSAAVTFATLLGAGAIGCVNQARVSIQGNTCRTGAMSGIVVKESNDLGEETGHAIVTGNDLTGYTRNGIYAAGKSRLTIHDNNIDTTGRSGIEVDDVEAENGLSIQGNHVLNCGGVSSIEVWDTTGAIILGNLCDTAATHGITVNTSTDAVVANNMVRNHVNRGIQIADTCVNASVRGNTVTGTGTSLIGMLLSSKVTIGGNRVTGCVTAYSGDFAWLRGTKSTTQVNSIGSAETDLVNLAVAANTLNEFGETIHLRCAGISANNADTKTIRVRFGAATLATFTLTVSQVSDWQVQVSVMRRSSVSAQRTTVTFMQGGTVKQYDFDFGDTTEDETAAIALRVTGQATTDNDVQLRAYEIDWKAA